MSAWMHVEGSVSTPRRRGVVHVLADGPMGSECGPMWTNLAAGEWFVHGDLRDRDEEDVPEFRDWFARAATAVGATKADLMLSGHCWCYVYELGPNGDLLLRQRMWDEPTWAL